MIVETVAQTVAILRIIDQSDYEIELNDEILYSYHVTTYERPGKRWQDCIG